MIPIKPLKHGAFSYRAHLPKLQARRRRRPHPHIDGRIGRRYQFKGRERSYVNARCSTGAIRTHGHFLFADGTIMDGTLEKPCTPVPPVPCRSSLRIGLRPGDNSYTCPSRAASLTG